MELAQKLRPALKLPEGLPETLDVTHVTEPVAGDLSERLSMSPRSRSIPRPAYPHVVKYTVVNDFGTVLNPMLVEGQVHGGVVQGIGQALLEQAVYDADGQLVTGSFMDYAMPRAHDAPMIEVTNRPVPTKTNPLGAKGCGEAGTSGGLPVGRQRGDRCAVGIRHPPPRNADDIVANLASDPGRAGKTAA